MLGGFKASASIIDAQLMFVQLLPAERDKGNGLPCTIYPCIVQRVALVSRWRALDAVPRSNRRPHPGPPVASHPPLVGWATSGGWGRQIDRKSMNDRRRSLPNARTPTEMTRKPHKCFQTLFTIVQGHQMMPTAFLSTFRHFCPKTCSLQALANESMVPGVPNRDGVQRHEF